MRRLTFRSLVPVLCAGFVATPLSRAAPQIPEKFENLQFFPKDIARDSLINIMRGFSFALGVRCQHCHTGGDGISFEGGSRNLLAGNNVVRARRADIRLDAFAGTTRANIVRANVVRAAGVDGIQVNPEHAGPVINTLLEHNIAIGAGDDGIDVQSATTTLTRNVAVHNGDLGIEAVPGVLDGGGNGNPAQCTNVDC